MSCRACPGINFMMSCPPSLTSRTPFREGIAFFKHYVLLLVSADKFSIALHFFQEHLIESVVYLVILGVWCVCVRDFDIVMDVFEFHLAKADGGDYSCAECSYVLWMLDRFNGMPGHVCKNLVYDVDSCKAACKADRIRYFALLGLAFQEPAEMEANTFDDGAE